MKRTVEPERLDALPPDDPDAIASRRDLRRLNRIMGHAATLRWLLECGAQKSPPRRIVELGAGDGTLMLRLAQEFRHSWPRMEVVLVDSQAAVTDETRRSFHSLGWKLETVAADVFDWLKKPDQSADLMFANLFLHHFSETQLSRLFALISERTKLFAACEPRRAAMPLAFSKMVGLIGCNQVTQYDAPTSVHAGFVGHELSALWPNSKDWQLHERRAKLFTHAFFAERVA